MILPRRALLAATLALPALRPAAAQSGYPDRPITLVVPFLAGGSTDIAARILAERMAPKLGPQARIVVENRAGAGGSVGADWVKHRPADGTTLLLASASALGSNPAALPQQTPYDPLEDFTQIAIVGGGPIVLVVPAASPFRTAQELLEAVKASPGRYTWATSGAGGIGHLTGEYLKIRAGGLPSDRGGPEARSVNRPAEPLRAEHVPYRGGSAVMEALAKGEVDYSLEVLASTAPHIRDGLSRGLAVSSLQRHPLFPDIPTLDEIGLKGFEVTTWNMLCGPRGLPPEVTAALSKAALAALAETTVTERMAQAGVDPARPATPAETRAFLAAEVAKFKAIVQEAGVKLGR
ncbi:Bug family tripartite tricarboxylate transporter substrate binding protein [Paracraurococcus lichenis]|uniref:Tripartite tricarboxylate transporter substrate binding protein n=1 Tax=Paracraurococcus lichenis TaxID=3064888 RepID=A0ABT9DWT2_9PROT|nr:tripartite tricarboxylate transporter substrate binding protein [Paracraurococcus sp. LOR1-02]MDO9708348.1 tripartite tricarboxylate transporter substrate binding protein [Paracraurococcus sp. LOR1-02]